MIYTERLKLVPIDLSYLNDIYELWSDYEVVKYTNVNLMTSLKECEDKVSFRINNQTDWTYPNNFVVLLEDKAIGLAGFPIMNKEKAEFGFYYQILRNCWGKGYASEVAESLLKYIFDYYPNATVFAGSVTENTASLKILKNLGFKEISIDEKAFKGYDIAHFKYVK